MMSAEELLGRIHAADPYAGFDPGPYPEDLQGWGSTEPNLHALIDESRPTLAIEVGSWKGASAVFMGSRLKRQTPPGKLLCVDTWLGALEFWTDPGDETRYKSLGLRHGYPSVYYQFLANVVRAGLRDIVIPFPQTSTIAAKWLRKNGVRAELVYIDASHDEDDVLSDLQNYWPLVTDRGVLFGDDYDWPSVRDAVDRFTRDNGFAFERVGLQWVIRKSGQARDCVHWLDAAKTARAAGSR
ncbi:MAG: class I SAM-dependent methyltransferase [Elusimicrobia bacterium]|nr:class I SAM-dependent methyltransferase [Elusimicrobiota bacterium]